MSVYASKRATCELKVILDVEDYCADVIRSCSKETSFPKRYRWCVTNDIIDLSVGTLNLLCNANDVVVYNEASLLLRRQYQTEAINTLKRLKNLLHVANRIHKVDFRTITRLLESNIQLQHKIVAWSRSDKMRYDSLTYEEKIKLRDESVTVCID